MKMIIIVRCLVSVVNHTPDNTLTTVPGLSIVDELMQFWRQRVVTPNIEIIVYFC